MWWYNIDELADSIVLMDRLLMKLNRLASRLEKSPEELWEEKSTIVNKNKIMIIKSMYQTIK